MIKWLKNLFKPNPPQRSIRADELAEKYGIDRERILLFAALNRTADGRKRNEECDFQYALTELLRIGHDKGNKNFQELFMLYHAVRDSFPKPIIDDPISMSRDSMLLGYIEIASMLLRAGVIPSDIEIDRIRMRRAFIQMRDTKPLKHPMPYVAVSATV